MKSKDEVIAQFNEEVNMTVEELEAWLEDPKSAKAGTGVGVESGHKIIEILKKNPTKDPEKYDDEDLDHMRKVAGYTKRHLAQEDHLKETKTPEELENAKSTISLKNWGHDPLKTLDEEQGNEPSSDSDPDGHDGHDVDKSQTQDEGEKDPPEDGDGADGGGEEGKPQEAKKRKLEGEELESSEETSAEENTSRSCGDDQEGEAGENGGVPEKAEGENGQDEPPRKKAKNDAAQ